MKGRRGRVNYGGRAFQQDAMNAMKGDIVRALIETITNADDAYGDRPGTGKVRVEIEHRRGSWKATTSDRAKGMRSVQLEKAITDLGGRTSGFEMGENVRGNLGRGAKDLAAFGQVTFESICDDYYSKLVLEENGDTFTASETKATKPLRDALGIPRGNGTVVTIHVNENIICPQHLKLAERLRKHCQLRDILSDPRREVTLVHVEKGDEVILRYAYPSLQTVWSGELLIKGYPEASATVTIYRNEELLDEPPSDPYRPGGLLIKGRRAIYESTYFGFENNSHSGWFSGRVECPYIDALAADYDRRLLASERQDETNPQPIISRSRDGLQHNHPFFRALAAAVEKPLGELIKAEEVRARGAASHENTHLRRALDLLGRDLARLIDEDLKEMQDEGIGGAEENGTKTPPIKLIPEQAVLYMGEDKTLTVQVRSDIGASEALVEVDPEGVVEILGDPRIPLSRHKKRDDLLVGQVRIRPILEGSETLLLVKCGEQSTVAIIEVRGERELVELPPPESLQFERDSYRVAWTKQKKLKIVAPVELVDQFGKQVTVISSDPGVVVRGAKTQLRLDEEVEYYVAEIAVEGRTLGARAGLTAELGSAVADCRVVVARDEEGPSIRIEVVNEERGKYRAVVEKEGDQTIIKIMGLHPAIKRYRGLGDDSPMVKAVIAEIVADQAVRLILEKKFPVASGGDRLDGAGFYSELYSYLNKYVARCHRVLVGDVSSVAATATAA
jgi:hypothetical protein